MGHFLVDFGMPEDKYGFSEHYVTQVELSNKLGRLTKPKPEERIDIGDCEFQKEYKCEFIEEGNKMSKAKFKVGDKVKIVKSHSLSATYIKHVGVVSEIIEINEQRMNYVSVDKMIYKLKEIPNLEWFSQELELTKGKIGRPAKPKPEDMTRYVCYGHRCNNLGTVFEDEKEMKTNLKLKTEDSSWSGRIIGYKMVPLYEVETKTILKSFKPVKKRKK